MHVAGGEDARDAGFVLVRFSQDIGSRVQVGLESVGDVFLASQETGCDQYQLCVNDFLAFLDRNHHHASALFIFFRLQADDDGFLYVAVFVFLEFFYRCFIDSRIVSEDCDGFFLAVIGFQYPRPLWPWVGWKSLFRWFRHHLQLSDGFRTQTDRRSHAVVTGITATDDQYMFSFC